MAESCSANWCGSAGAIIIGPLDLDQQNAAETVSWQRPVLLLPADSVVPAIFFDFENTAPTRYVRCTGMLLNDLAARCSMRSRVPTRLHGAEQPRGSSLRETNCERRPPRSRSTFVL